LLKFNTGYQNTSLVTVGREGDGILLEIFVGRPDFLRTYITEKRIKGLEIVIEDQSSFPLNPHGLVIQPGTHTSIKLQKTEAQTLPSPYSDCQDVDSVSTTIANEMKRIGLNYTRRNCIAICQQNITIHKFGCYNLILPRIFNSLPCLNQSIYNQLEDVI
jgi:hypothetical protein